MSQIEVELTGPARLGIDHGGYIPQQVQVNGLKTEWRGHQIPDSYLFDWGFQTERRPTNTDLMDRIAEALNSGPLTVRQLREITGGSVFDVSKHLDLMRELDVVRYGPWIIEEQSREIMLNIEVANQ